MPVAPTYPGVYVEEIPSGVRTITGVATSITAFIGRARRGPVNVATTLHSFGDFEKAFGGLWVDNALGFAVRDFFLNGGSQALVVRLYHAAPAPDGGAAPAAKASLAVGDVKLVAASEGKWGVNLRATVDLDNVSDEIATSLGVTKADVFNLTVRDSAPGGKTERYLNLTLKDSQRRVDKVLADNSDLVAFDGTPDATKTPAAGIDALSTKEKACD